MSDGKDYTKYDVEVAGTAIGHSLGKRATVYCVVRALCDRGVSPEAIMHLPEWAGWKSGRFVLFGDIDDPERWFCRQGELFQNGSKSWALSNQWGIKMFDRSLRELLASFPEHLVSYRPTKL
jgi:hypothetical protein